MSGAQDIGAYKDGIVILATAAVAVPLLQRLRISPVLGYLLTGMLLGPHMIGALTRFMPAAEWFTISNPDLRPQRARNLDQGYLDTGGFQTPCISQPFVAQHVALGDSDKGRGAVAKARVAQG